MKLKRGSTSVRRLVFVADSSSSTGAGLTGLAYTTTDLAAYYYAGDLSGDVQITLASATLGTYTSGGFVEVDATNMPGWYEIGIPNAALDGGKEVAIQIAGAENMVPVNIYIELDTVDYQTTAFGANTTAPLDAAGVRSAVGMAVANLDTQIGTLATATALASAKSSIESSCATATGFATHSAADVWSVDARTLTAGTNLSLIDAAGVRSAVGMAVANLDTQLGTLATATALASAKSSIESSCATATGFATHSAADVWSVDTRTLTAGGGGAGDATAATQGDILVAIAAVNAKLISGTISVASPPTLVDGELSPLKLGADYTAADAGTSKLDNRVTFEAVNLSALISDATDWTPRLGLAKGSVRIEADGTITGDLDAATLAFPLTTAATKDLKKGTYDWDVELWRGTANVAVLTGQVELSASAIGRTGT